MARVVTKDADVSDAVDVCPVGAIKENEGKFAIDPSMCIDCGICQSAVAEGEIKEESEADEEDVAFNAENAPNW
jgi:Fe-S-cluster-containing hydrogenase component 2